MSVPEVEEVGCVVLEGGVGEEERGWLREVGRGAEDAVGKVRWAGGVGRLVVGLD